MRHERRADDGSWLPPVDAPSKVVATHLTYRSRVEEYRMAAPPEYPSYFLMPPSAVSAHLAPVARPRGCRYLNYEGELAVVIGRRCLGVSVEDALSYVRGYTIANDFGVHDFRHADRGAMLRVKGRTGSAPSAPAWWTPPTSTRTTSSSARSSTASRSRRAIRERTSCSPPPTRWPTSHAT